MFADMKVDDSTLLYRYGTSIAYTIGEHDPGLAEASGDEGALMQPHVR